MLPDYMVHQEWSGQTKQEETEHAEKQANIAPFAYDQVCVIYLIMKYCNDVKSVTSL